MNDKKFARLMKRDGIDEATVLSVRIRFGNLLAQKTFEPGPERRVLSDTMVNWCLDDAQGDLSLIMSPKLLKWIARSTVMKGKERIKDRHSNAISVGLMGRRRGRRIVVKNDCFGKSGIACVKKTPTGGNSGIFGHEHEKMPWQCGSPAVGTWGNRDYQLIR